MFMKIHQNSLGDVSLSLHPYDFGPGRDLVDGDVDLCPGFHRQATGS